MPYINPGCLHPSNGKDSIDWNDAGLLAHSSHNVIFIVDVMNYRRIQSMTIHQAAVNIIRWSPATSHFSESISSNPLLASCDISGQIIISNPINGIVMKQFCYSNYAVLQMQWYPWKDILRDFLLVLHSSSNVVLWNTRTGEKVWCRSYSHVALFNFSIDPFAIKNVVFSSSCNKLLICSDLGLSEPLSSGMMFDVGSEELKTNQSNIHMLEFHKAYRNTLFAAINNHVYYINPELMCVLAKFPIEANILSWFPSSRRDAVFSVHTNGAVRLRVGKYADCDEKRPTASFRMEKICETECYGKTQRIMAAALCPTTQSNIAVIYQNGKIVIWQLQNRETALLYRSSFIEDFLEFNSRLQHLPRGDLSIHQLNEIGAISSGVTCSRMRPMDELVKVENDKFAKTPLGTLHLAAVGTTSGTIHLIDVFTSQVFREFRVQASPIKCLEWGGVYSIVTAGYNVSLSASQLVRNEIFITDIRTGVNRRIRPEVNESHVTIIRVSYYHCYLAIAFQCEPLEIWDLKGLRLLRKMSKSCPLIIDMAWSNKHHGMKTTEATQQSVYRENLVLLDAENRIYHITLRGLHVRDGKMVNTQWKKASAQICAMAWKDDMLAVGDVEGSLVVWDLGKQQSRHVRGVSHSRVLRMFFSRLAGDHTLAVLHSREVTLWDTEAMTQIQSIRADKSQICIDLDLCGLSPVILTNDNQLRFVASNTKNSAIPEKDIPRMCREDCLGEIRKVVNDGSDLKDLEMSNLINELRKRKAVPESVECDTSKLINERTIRRFVGDHFASDLLSIVIDRFGSDATNHLPPHLQLFWHNRDFKERESRVIGIACGSESAIERRLVEQAVVVGGEAKEKVTDRLIVSADLRHASIKAALLVSSQENEKAKSLIKLIATNLIASDLIEDGVELLFLVGAGADACKYLQSQKQWTKSIVYAKMGLEDTNEIEAKWIAHLADEARQSRVLADAARRNWPDVVEAISSVDPILARLILRTTTSTPPISTCPSP